MPGRTDLEPRACIVCGSKFQPYRDYQHTCSRACRTRAKDQQLPEVAEQAPWAEPVAFRCQLCGTEFEKLYSGGAKPRWCDTCRPDGRRDNQARKNVARRVDANPVERRAINLRQNLSRYGVTVEQYNAKLAAQNGRCFICGSPPDPNGIKSASRLHVDHDHVTGLNRELLCTRCNQGIGYFRDNPVLLRAAAGYIEQHR